MSIKLLNEFLPEAEQIRLGGIKVGDTLQINNGTLNTNTESVGISGNRLTYIKTSQHAYLNNNTITLKAGSTVYIPNGFESDEVTPKFTAVNISANLSRTGEAPISTRAFIVYNPDTNGLSVRSITNTTSGSMAPTSSSGYYMWYDTTTNLIKLYENGVLTCNAVSLPICLLNTDADGNFTSVAHTFGGNGFIGDRVFFLPGIRGLIPNGFTSDTDLAPASTTFETNKVLIAQVPNAILQTYKAYLNANQLILSNEYYYDGNSNKNKLITNTNQTLAMAETNCWAYCNAANKISSFQRAFIELSAYDNYNDPLNTWELRSISYLNANKGWAFVGQKKPTGGDFVPFLRQKSTNGVFLLNGRNTAMEITYTADSTITANTNVVTHRLILLDESGNASFPGQITAAGTVNATATSARWADLAEKYIPDAKYPIGTLICFDGEKEITIAKKKVNGVISEKPGYTLNAKSKGQPIALCGKTKVRVIGIVHKNDKLVLYKDGIACTKKWYHIFKKTVGLALETNTRSEEKLIMSVVQLII